MAEPRRASASSSSSTNNVEATPYKRHSVSEKPVTSVLSPQEVVYSYDAERPDNTWSNDDEVLAALGYKPEFKREFSFFTTFSVSFAVLGLLPSFATTLSYGLGYAGTAGMTWGWLVAWVGVECVALSMAEICSAMPTSGGLYYASAVLAPPRWGPLASWITGWSNWLGQITATPSIDYGVASIILATASIQNPAYTPQNYQVFLLATFILILHAFLASMPTKWIAQFNTYGSAFNGLALAVVIIMIPAATNRPERHLPRFSSSSEVWGTIYRGTDWPPGISVLMSFLGIIWTLSGYDAPFHLSEECSNANIASPRAIVMTATTGGILGFFLQLVVAYTVVNVGDVVNSTLGQPFAAYLYQCMPNNISVAILALTVVAGFSMGQGNQVAASRVTFAYARDDCFPFSSWIKKVNKTTKTPVNAVITNTVIGICELFLIFGGTYTIGALFSIGAIAAFVAFTVPIFIKTFFVGNRFRKGPWHLGRFSPIIGVVSCAFVALMVPIMCFPASTGHDLNAQTMNWTIVCYGGPMLMIMIWWVLSAHKWFKGPKINLEHMDVVGGRVDIKSIEGADATPGPGEKVNSEDDSSSIQSKLEKGDAVKQVTLYSKGDDF